jgi:hypothetical protein
MAAWLSIQQGSNQAATRPKQGSVGKEKVAILALN